MLIPLALGLLSLCLAFVKFLKPPSYLNQVPLVRPWYPLVGNVFVFLGKSSEELFSTIHSLFSKYDRMFQLWFGVQPAIGVVHPDLMRKVLTSGACLDKPFFYRFSRIDQGLWAAKTSLWRSQRKALNATFSPSVITNFIPIFEHFSKLLVHELFDSEGNAINFLRLTSACTLKMICRTTMGIDENETADIDEFMSNMDKISEIVGRRFFSIHIHSERIYRMTAAYHQEMEFRRKCNSYTFKILNRKKHNREHTESRKVFIEQLLDGSALGRTFTSTEIIQNVYGMLAAGSETTALTMAQACLFLAMFPDIQEKVFTEIINLCPDAQQPLTTPILSDLIYLEAFLKECLRLCPVAPIIARESTEPVELDGTQFPKGTIFILNFFTLHRRLDIWGPDCDRFDPERFLTGNIEDRHPFGFLPFCGGQRNCIGKRYAMMSLKVMVVHLLRSFRMSTPIHFEDLQYKLGLLLELPFEYLVHFNKR